VGLAKRLHRIHAPTLLVFGADDRVLPPSYAKRFADGLSGLVQVRRIEAAGHMLEIDAPDAAADAVLAFLD
jgi:pimeloyl-ACP methyl ester carboxylesterase